MLIKLIIVVISLLSLVAIIELFNLAEDKYLSLWGWEPCDEGTKLDKVTKLIIGQLECKCCILLRGAFIGVYLMLILNIIFR